MIPKDSKSQIVQTICDALQHADVQAAAEIAQRDYAFLPRPAASRQFNRETITSVFIEDGCIDRYSGSQLVFMGTLLLLSRLLLKEIPYQSNWKIEETHMAFWELAPTIDHVVPVTRGGLDERSNWVTTSGIHNSAKAHWTLEELGWTLQPKGDVTKWDGLTKWFWDMCRLIPNTSSTKP
jgi:hypothetical protein